MSQTFEAAQAKLALDYAEYLQAAEKLRAGGKAIGTFIGWLHANNKIGIQVAKRTF